MSFWFRTYRENVDDPQNSMLAEMFKLILQARQQQFGSINPTDLEKKRVSIIPYESFLIFVSDGCFVTGKQRYLNVGYKWYVGREPDGNVCKCMFEFDHRSNKIIDRSLRGNNAILKGYPKIIAYQPEYPYSALKFDGASFVDMGTTQNLNQGTTAGSEISYAFWIRYDANPAVTARIINRGNAPSLIPYVTTSGELRCDFKYQDATTFTAISGVSTKSVYHRVVCSHSDKDDISEMYVDGVLVASNVKNTFLRDSGAGAEDRFMLGAAPTSSTTEGSFLTGYLDDCRVYERRITAAEAAADYLGDEISSVGLISQWHFDEDERTDIAVDEQGYNTGTITGAVFEKTIIPSIFVGKNKPYNDGMIDQLIGHKTSGQYLVIPELQDDFRITGKTTGGCYYTWTIKFTSFAKDNDNYMRLLQKADDLTGNYIQSIQIREDGKLYVFGKFNGVNEKVRTVNPLKLNKLYDPLVVGMDYNDIAGGNELDIFQVYLNGFPATIETTTEDPEYPATADITDLHTYLHVGNEEERGHLNAQIYKFRYYDEDVTDTNVLGLATNKFTTYNIDRGHVARNNMTKLPLTYLFREKLFELPKSLISEEYSYLLSDTVLTGRFTSPVQTIPVSDEFDFFLTPGAPTLGNYAIDITNTTNIHSWVEVPPIDPVKKNFSVFAWVKYRGKVGDWGGIISALDGLHNANRLLITDTKIRYHGQFGTDTSKLSNFEVTVPSIANAYHLIGFTYDGDKKNQFIIFLDGLPQKIFKQKGEIKGTDKSKSYIGKGATTGFYLDGLVDDVFIYNRTLSQSEVLKLQMKDTVRRGMFIHYNWERTFKDVENGKFNGKSKGTVKFSDDHV